MKVSRSVCLGGWLALLIVAPLAAQPAPPVCDDGKCIQVGSYNLELFGNESDSHTHHHLGSRAAVGTARG